MIALLIFIAALFAAEFFFLKPAKNVIRQNLTAIGSVILFTVCWYLAGAFTLGGLGVVLWLAFLPFGILLYSKIMS